MLLKETAVDQLKCLSKYADEVPEYWVLECENTLAWTSGGSDVEQHDLGAGAGPEPAFQPEGMTEVKVGRWEMCSAPRAQ